MKKAIGVILLVAVAVLGVGAAIAFETGEADHAAAPAADTVFLGEQDLAERMEIWRNQYRRMTPGDAPLLQDVGTWPAAWEEFSSRWASAPAERNLATWLVPVTAERSGALTVLRDADGNALWSGVTDFFKEESANVTLTGALVDEEEWPLWKAAGEEIDRRLDAMRGTETRRPPRRRDGDGGSGGNGTNDGPKMFMSASADFTSTPPEFRVGLQWTNTGTLDVFAYGPLHTSSTHSVTFTNDENQVVTNTITNWHCAEPGLRGFSNDWAWVGTATISDTNPVVFVDTNFSPERAHVRFYAAAVALDSDGDGLNDGVEIFETGTDPGNWDSDHDGEGDGTERAAGANPSVSNIWWEVTTTNKFHWWRRLGTNIPTTPQYVADYPVVGNRPTTNSVVNDVKITGFVDDILCVDSNVVGGWDAGPTNFANLSVLAQTTNAQSGRLTLKFGTCPSRTTSGRTK